MPQVDTSKYPYIPEQSITKEEYYELMESIVPERAEIYDDDQLMCEGGACPIEPDRVH